MFLLCLGCFLFLSNSPSLARCLSFVLQEQKEAFFSKVVDDTKEWHILWCHHLAVLVRKACRSDRA